MNYTSTRGISTECEASAYAIKTGLAKDGGLFMPETIPSLDKCEIEELIALPYAERAAKVLAKFLTDYTYEELLSDTESAYCEASFGAHPAPVTKIDDETYMLELWHGPTCAFKDMALQIMPKLFVRALRKCGEERTAMILVATSGDTGKAALEGYKNVEGTKIKVFYPTGGVSRIQKLQMQTQEGDNVSVSGIVGNFDDAQNGVKRIFSDPKMAEALGERGIFLSSANSINWGRLVPQIVYYISAYCDMVKEGVITLGEKIDVCVPTGNFGNIFAGYIAKMMGLPIEKLVCASNVNNILTDFLRTGVYDRNRAFHATMSPSMDILISSNLERLLYTVIGTKKTAEYMKSLVECGRYELSAEDLAKISEHFLGYYTSEEETVLAIKDAYENKKRLIDTHTAVAYNAAKCYMSDYKAERRMLVVSTASAYKFAADVYSALTGKKASSDLEAPYELEAYCGVAMPSPISALRGKPVLHDGTINASEMEAATLDFAN